MQIWEGEAHLTVVAGALEYDAFRHKPPFEFVVSVLAMAVGLAWLWAIVKEWRAHASSKPSQLTRLVVR